MCGRFNVQSDPLSQLLMELVGLVHPGPDNLNLAPTETVQVLRVDAHGAPQLAPMRWWLTPFWAKEVSSRYSMFNAKAETAAKSPAFKEPYRKRRCVVPVRGFYEWSRNQSPVAPVGNQGESGESRGIKQGQKTPYFILPRDYEGLLLAGLWDGWRNKETGEELLSFTILTTEAAPELSFVHHRQPVMLSPEQAHDWLNADIATNELESLFASCLPMSLEVVPLSSRINNARHKDAECSIAVADPVQVSAASLQETLH